MATLAHIVALLLVNLQYHDTTHTYTRRLPCCRLGYKTQVVAFVLGADKGFLFPLSVSSLLWSPCINHPLMRLQLMIELLIKGQTCGERKQWMWERKIRSAKQQIKRQKIKNKVKSWCKLERRGKGWQTIKRKKERVNRQKDGRSVRIETANRRTREERGREGKKKKERDGRELSVGHRRECVACWHCFHAAHFKGLGLWRERGASDNGKGRK